MKVNLLFYMRKSIKFLLFFIILFLLGICFYGTVSESGDKIEINDVEFSVEIVDDESARAKGLSGREDLCERCGMLFVFDEVGRYGFWMRDMKFDIDILWIRNGEIVYIEKGVSHEIPEVVYGADVDSNLVLELDSGVVDEFGIEVGDRVEL